MPVEQGLPWHPVPTGLAGRAIPFVVAASHAHALPSPPFWFPVLVASPASLRPSSLPAVLTLVPPGVAPASCVSVLLLPVCWHSKVPLLRTHSCPTRLPPPPPVRGFHVSVDYPVRGWLVTALLPPPWLVVATVLALHGPPVHCCESCWGSSHCRVWGGPVPSCFATSVPPNLVLLLLLLAHSPLLVCPTGGAACRSVPPAVAVKWSHCDVGGTRGTKHLCTCLQICKLTCHSCLLELLCSECDALLLLRILGC